MKVDAYARTILQAAYDKAWDWFGIPIGTFRFICIWLPIVSDLCLEAHRGLSSAAILSLGIVSTGVLVFYPPSRIVADNRMQERCRYHYLNAKASKFAETTLSLRIFYFILSVATLVAYHHLRGLALTAVLYTNCVFVRARRDFHFVRSLKPSAA